MIKLQDMLLLALVLVLTHETIQVKTRTRRAASLSNSRYQCGVRKRQLEDLITKGGNTKLGEWPWHGGLFYLSNRLSRDYKCGVTLIHQNFVITASHCVVNRETGYEINAGLVTVDFGYVKLFTPTTYSQTPKVQKIIVHPEFAAQIYRHDVALLSLQSTVKFNDYVLPICLELTRSETNIHDIVGQHGVVLGWGLTEDDEFSLVLKVAHVPVVDYPYCQDTDRDLFAAVIYPGMFCGGFRNGTSVCNGDSGGGVYFSKGGKWYLRGITSFSGARDIGSNKCEVEKYAGFVNVQYYASWIRQKMFGEDAPSNEITTERGRYYGSRLFSATSSETHPKLKLLPKDCGRAVGDRLRFGKFTNIFEYPWMAILQYKHNGTIIDGCDGSLINKRYILTTAKCVIIEIDMPLHSVVLGEHTRNQEIDCSIYKDMPNKEIKRVCADPIEIFLIEKFIIHPDYNRPKFSNDVALIRLDRDVVINDHIRPICLPVTSTLQKATFDTYTVTSWGLTDAGESSNILQHFNPPHVSIGKCQRIMNENKLYIQLSDKQLCAGEVNGTDSRKVTAGAPLGSNATYDGTRFVQFGIVSAVARSYWKYSVPVIYSRVSSYMDWILDNMNA